MLSNWKKNIVHFSLFLIMLLSGCTIFSLSPRPSETPLPSITPSPTILWFPPTPTPTANPTINFPPTPDYHPDLGQVIVQDDFTNTTYWSLMDKPFGTAAYSQSRLTLAVSLPNSNVFSIRKEPVLQDFYLEMTSVTSLCRNKDSYGILVRINSVNDFYRFQVNCNGLLKVERTRNLIVNTLQDWTSSSQVTAGYPITMRWGIWVKSDRMRLFINDVFQFEIKDQAFYSGQIGVFARSAGENAVTVNFSDLQIRLLEDGNPPFTPTPAPTAKTTSTP
jgi:hypothetical protein